MLSFSRAPYGMDPRFAGSNYVELYDPVEHVIHDALEIWAFCLQLSDQNKQKSIVNTELDSIFHAHMIHVLWYIYIHTYSIHGSSG